MVIYMNINVLKKLIAILLISVFTIFLFGQNYCYAENSNYRKKELSDGGGSKGLDNNTGGYYDNKGSDIISNPDDYKPNVTSDQDFKITLSVIVGIIRAFGIVVGVISLMIIGVKFLVGSVEEKAEYKKVIPGYVLGAIMVMAISLIPTLIYDVTKDL